MSDIRENILEASVQVLMRYGVGRTRMGDIAQEAGVVRQTLYSFFKSKNEILCAAIRHYGALSLRDIQSAWANASNLEEKIDIFFEHAILRSFAIITASADARDMIGGYNDAGKAETERAQVDKVTHLAAELSKHVGQAASKDIDGLAEFIVLSALGVRDYAKDEAQLKRLLATLKASVMARISLLA